MGAESRKFKSVESRSRILKTRVPDGASAMDSSCAYSSSRARTSRLKLTIERYTYCWKWGQPFQVQRPSPNTRLSHEMHPSMPARKRRSCR